MYPSQTISNFSLRLEISYFPLNRSTKQYQSHTWYNSKKFCLLWSVSESNCIFGSIWWCCWCWLTIRAHPLTSNIREHTEKFRDLTWRDIQRKAFQRNANHIRIKCGKTSIWGLWTKQNKICENLTQPWWWAYESKGIGSILSAAYIRTPWAKERTMDQDGTKLM